MEGTNGWDTLLVYQAYFTAEIKTGWYGIIMEPVL